MLLVHESTISPPETDVVNIALSVAPTKSLDVVSSIIAVVELKITLMVPNLAFPPVPSIT